MTERKKLKKELSRLKQLRSNLPRFIDCSMVYGDNSFTKHDLVRVNRDIKKIERLISNIDKA